LQRQRQHTEGQASDARQQKFFSIAHSLHVGRGATLAADVSSSLSLTRRRADRRHDEQLFIEPAASPLLSGRICRRIRNSARP
jgi:hypothetical protein